jgi:hypothetical protein
MITTAQRKAFASYVGPWDSQRHEAGKSPLGLLRRLLDAIYESRQRQTEREIARILARSGGRITDATEREMTRRFLGL